MQNNYPARPPLPRWPVYLAFGLLGLFTLIFLVELVTSTEAEMAAPAPTPVLTSDTYMDRVTPLLASADPQRGALLVEEYLCVACHRLGAENGIAPAFVGIAGRAATRRPPLTAPAYIFESITDPLAYVVAGFNPAMPHDYLQRLTDQQLGDIIAYLLSPGAR